jgi:hypothetical protein
MPNYVKVINGIVTEALSVDPDLVPDPPDGWTKNQNRWTHPNLGQFIPWDHDIALANGYIGPTNLHVGDIYNNEGESL